MLLNYETAVDSQSKRSHVQILHYTFDDKRSILVLPHNVISRIGTLNVKLLVCDFCKRPTGKRTNGRMGVNRLKQNILHVHEVYGLCKWFMIIYWQIQSNPTPSHFG